MKVVITIPAYNEERTLGGVLEKIKKVMDSTKYNYQILVVNDGSKDRTVEVAEKHGAIVVSHPRNYGLAEAFRTEMEQCVRLKADIIVHTDADGQYRAEEIPNLIQKVESGYDFVLASRFKGHIESMPLLKQFGNRAFSKVISQITNTKITDGQTGFRAFTREVAEKIKITSTHTYTQEQIIRVVRKKFKLLEVPAYFAKRGGNTKSRLMKNPFDYAVKAWINLFRVYRDYEPLKFFGFIGGSFFFVGIILGFFIVTNILLYGVAGGIPRVILSALMILSGIQIWLFGFLADMHKK
jgi:glycosyltransferase involved in cell wall biosynthesis